MNKDILNDINASEKEIFKYLYNEMLKDDYVIRKRLIYKKHEYVLSYHEHGLTMMELIYTTRGDRTYGGGYVFPKYIKRFGEVFCLWYVRRLRMGMHLYRYKLIVKYRSMVLMEIKLGVFVGG